MTYSHAFIRCIARFAIGLAAIVGLVTASSPAAAQDFEAGGAIGPYLSFTFGDEVGIGYGVDATILLSEGDRCDSVLGGGFGVGPMFQVGGVNTEFLRLVFGAAIGGEIGGGYDENFRLEEPPALLGEVGYAGHFQKGKNGSGVHTGLKVQSPFFVNGFARAEWLLDEYSVGAGAGFPQIFQKPDVCDE